MMPADFGVNICCSRCQFRRHRRHGNFRARSPHRSGVGQIDDVDRRGIVGSSFSRCILLLRPTRFPGRLHTTGSARFKHCDRRHAEFFSRHRERFAARYHLGHAVPALRFPRAIADGTALAHGSCSSSLRSRIGSTRGRASGGCIRPQMGGQSASTLRDAFASAGWSSSAHRRTARIRYQSTGCNQTAHSMVPNLL